MGRLIKLIKFALFILIAYLIISVGWQYISMKIEKAQLKGEMRELMFGQVRLDEYTIKDKLLQTLRSKDINLEYDELIVQKPSERSIYIDFTYTDSIVVPIINKVFYFDQKITTSVNPR